MKPETVKNIIRDAASANIRFFISGQETMASQTEGDTVTVDGECVVIEGDEGTQWLDTSKIERIQI